MRIIILHHQFNPSYSITIMFKCFVVAALFALTAADNAPRYGAEPNYDEPAVYSYNYAVADDYSGSRFNAGENRDGYSTSGSYSVNLPDGRIQTVNYKVADAYSGYVADVTYSGEAKYSPAPAPYKPAPAPYKPAPAPYKAAPAPYKAAPALYKAAPAPYQPAPAPYKAAPAPYNPAPVYKSATVYAPAPAYAPALAPAYAPAPAPTVYKTVPVYKSG